MERRRSKTSQVTRSWLFSFLLEFIVGFSIGFILSAFYHGTLMQPLDSLAPNLFFGLLSGLMAYSTIELLKYRDLLQRVMASFVENKSAPLLRYFHALPNNRHFELVMKTFDELGSSRWVLSEFIHWKLKTDFSSVSEIRIANMDAAEYSRLLCTLINVAKDSVFMTCPYLPSTWLDAFKIKNDMTDNNMPAHFRAFLSRHGIDRARILNLEENDYKKLSDKDEKKELVRFAKPVDEECKKGFLHKRNIVHCILNLNSHGFSDEQIEKWKLDYSVFDKSIVILWRTNNNHANNRMGNCVLVFDNTEVEKYSALFGLLETDRSKFKHVSDFKNGGT